MLLSALISRDEVVALVESLAPLRISIDERRGRTVTVDRIAVEFVENEGIRLRGEARIAWDVAGVGVSVTIRAWQVLLRPRITAAARGRLVDFEPVIEVLELKQGFMGDRIAAAIRDAVAQHRGRLAWDFARALSRRMPVPRIGAAFELAVRESAVTVGVDELRLSIVLVPLLERSAVSGQRPAATSSRQLNAAR